MNEVTVISACADEGNFPASLDKEGATLLFLEAGGREFPFKNADRFCCDVSTKYPPRFLYAEYIGHYIARMELQTGNVQVRGVSPECFYTDWFNAF